MDNKLETRCVHGDLDAALEDGNCSICFPIYQTASFSGIRFKIAI